LWRQPAQKIFADSAVTTVDRVDSQWQGALIGFALGFFPVTIAACADDDDGGMACFGAVVAAGPLLGLSGAAIGAIIDGRHNKTVYRAATPAIGRAAVTFAPMLTPRAAGGFLSVRFQ
jgi:hypothetical protein